MKIRPVPRIHGDVPGSVKSGHSIQEKLVAKPVDVEPKEAASRYCSRLTSGVVRVSTEEVDKDVPGNETRSRK